MSESGSGDEETGAFRVVDRRRFDAEGRERDDSEASSSESTTAPSPVTPAAAPEMSAPETLADDAPSDPSVRPPEASAAPIARPSGTADAVSESQAFSETAGSPGEAPPPTFSSLILSLSTQALFALGEIAESPDAEPQIDLQAGRQLIDLLGVLQEKTHGNLDEDESQLMERILYDLRLRFVEISRRSPSP